MWTVMVFLDKEMIWEFFFLFKLENGNTASGNQVAKIQYINIFVSIYMSVQNMPLFCIH